MAKDKPTENDVVIVRVTETTKRLRLVVLGLLTAFALWLLKDGYVHYLASKPKTEAWERVVSNILTAVVSLAAPSCVTIYLWKKVRAFTKRIIGRLTSLEADADPKRTTSGLQSDGTDPPGATP